MHNNNMNDWGYLFPPVAKCKRISFKLQKIVVHLSCLNIGACCVTPEFHLTSMSKIVIAIRPRMRNSLTDCNFVPHFQAVLSTFWPVSFLLLHSSLIFFLYLWQVILTLSDQLLSSFIHHFLLIASSSSSSSSACNIFLTRYFRDFSLCKCP